MTIDGNLQQGFKGCPRCRGVLPNETEQCPTCWFEFSPPPVYAPLRMRQGGPRRSTVEGVVISVLTGIPLAFLLAALTASNQIRRTNSIRAKEEATHFQTFEAELAVGASRNELDSRVKRPPDRIERVAAGHDLPHGEYRYYVIDHGQERVVLQRGRVTAFEYVPVPPGSPDDE